MKLSKYTSFFQYGTRTVIFNSANECLLMLDTELADLFRKNIDNINVLSKLHPSFYKQLEVSKFIIADSEDETHLLLKKWIEEDFDSSFFGVIINPTLKCNLQCWYCYESHVSDRIMSDEIMNAIVKLIDKKTLDSNLKVLNVSFFGGEPLLAFSEIVFPILKKASEMCQKRKIKLYSNFTTNGTLLNKKRLSELNSLSLAQLPTFQITLDGGCESHNQIRIGHDKKTTYNLIIENIVYALECGNEVYIRLNYTYNNIFSFYDVIDDFQGRNLESYKNLHIKFEHVWQDASNLELVRPILFKIKELFIDAGFDVEIDDIHFRHVCYADSPNHIVINYDGNLFKCTARDFIQENREGVIDNEGDISVNEKFNNRMQIRYKNPECLKCKILPICNGGCSQNKIEAYSNDICYKNFTEEQKEKYLKNRIEEILDKRIKSKGNVANV